MLAEPEPIRLLLVEDQPHYLDGLHEDLERFPRQVTIVGEATNADEALRLVQRLAPDVVLVDLELPQSGSAQDETDVQVGLSLIEQIHDWATHHSPKTRILVLTVSIRKPYILYSALRAGAHGYIGKQERLVGQHLVAKIQEVVRGAFRPGPAVMEQMRGLATLTPREQEVLELLIEGKSDKDIQQAMELTGAARERKIRELRLAGKTDQEIQKKLHVASGTVSAWIGSIISKLQLADRSGDLKR